MVEIYAIEWNGDNWQSVFPSKESEKSQLHPSVQAAYDYIRHECGIADPITIYGSEK